MRQDEKKAMRVLKYAVGAIGLLAVAVGPNPIIVRLGALCLFATLVMDKKC